MGENMKNKNAKIVSASSRAVFFLAFFLLLLLTVSCFLYTTFVDKENDYLEHVTIETDNVGTLLLFVAALFVILFFITKLVRKLQFKKLILLFGLYALTSGIIFVFMARSYPTNDSYAVTAVGAGLARGDTGELIRHTDYFTRYPFQLGYVLWTEIFSFLTGTGDGFLALEVVNAVCLAFAECGLIALSRILSEKDGVPSVCALFLILFPQATFYSVFLYGNIPSLCFAVWSVYFFFRYLKNGKRTFVALSALFLLVGVWLKLNTLIVFVALMIVYVLHIIKEKKWLECVPALCFCLLIIFGRGLPQKFYEARYGLDFGDGIPMVSWAAMGLGDSSPIFRGWYDPGPTVQNFSAAGKDSVKAAEKSREQIAERLSEMLKEPSSTLIFFKNKTVSQWAEPTYQSVWNIDVRGVYPGERTGIAEFAVGHQRETAEALDVSVILLYGMACAGCAVFLLRKKREETLFAALLALIFLGGFFYHLIFEAKSQYILIYALWLTPLSAVGADACFEKFGIIVRKAGKLIGSLKSRSGDAGEKPEEREE